MQKKTTKFDPIQIAEAETKQAELDAAGPVRRKTAVLETTAIRKEQLANKTHIEPARLADFLSRIDLLQELNSKNNPHQKSQIERENYYKIHSKKAMTSSEALSAPLLSAHFTIKDKEALTLPPQLYNLLSYFTTSPQIAKAFTGSTEPLFTTLPLGHLINTYYVAIQKAVIYGYQDPPFSSELTPLEKQQRAGYLQVKRNIESLFFLLIDDKGIPYEGAAKAEREAIVNFILLVQKPPLLKTLSQTDPDIFSLNNHQLTINLKNFGERSPLEEFNTFSLKYQTKCEDEADKLYNIARDLLLKSFLRPTQSTNVIKNRMGDRDYITLLTQNFTNLKVQHPEKIIELDQKFIKFLTKFNTIHNKFYRKNRRKDYYAELTNCIIEFGRKNNIFFELFSTFYSVLDINEKQYQALASKEKKLKGSSEKFAQFKALRKEAYEIWQQPELDNFKKGSEKILQSLEACEEDPLIFKVRNPFKIFLQELIEKIKNILKSEHSITPSRSPLMSVPIKDAIDKPIPNYNSTETARFLKKARDLLQDKKEDSVDEKNTPQLKL